MSFLIQIVSLGCVITVIISAPSGPIQNLYFTNTSHTITLFWSPPLPSQRNGIIISYSVNCSLNNNVTYTTRTSNTSLTITGLEPFTNYTCSLSASTIVGDGPKVDNHAVTNEDSKYTYCIYILLTIFYPIS